MESKQMKHETNALQRAWGITKKVLTGIALAICVMLVIIAGWLCIDKFIIKSKVPSMFGYSTLMVATGSMSGTIEEGDLILIKDRDEYKIGMIVTYIKPGETIPTTHRIIRYGETEGSFILKGDANNAEDTTEVLQSEILGEVVDSYHVLGLFVGWMKEGGGYIYLIGVILIIGIAVFLMKDDSMKLTLQTDSSGEENGGGADAVAADENIAEVAENAEETNISAKNDEQNNG